MRHPLGRSVVAILGALLAEFRHKSVSVDAHQSGLDAFDRGLGSGRIVRRERIVVVTLDAVARPSASMNEGSSAAWRKTSASTLSTGIAMMIPCGHFTMAASKRATIYQRSIVPVTELAPRAGPGSRHDRSQEPWPHHHRQEPGRRLCPHPRQNPPSGPHKLYRNRLISSRTTDRPWATSGSGSGPGSVGDWSAAGDTERRACPQAQRGPGTRGWRWVR
jgi:hypothetical protein